MSESTERPEVVKLLLVDDRNDDLEILRLTLDAPGHELVSARSGSEALRRVLTEDFACIVLDVLLPVMDGFEVASLIKSRDRSKHTPILFLTAAGADMRFIYRAYQVGAVDFMTKPIDPDVLRAKVAIFADLFRKDQRIKRQAEALREAVERQKEAELAALREGAEKRYRHLADAFPSIVWTARPDGGVEYANRRWHEYTGMSKDRSRGWGWLEAIHTDDVARVQPAWREATERMGELTFEVRIQRGSGEHRWHICSATPELDTDGALIGWVATMTDTEDLRQAIAARDEFLAVASHELRTPLSTLALAVHGLRRAIDAANLPEQSAKLVGKVDMAERQVNRLDKLVSALLDVTRIVGRKVALEPVDCDLSSIARDVVERLRDQAERVGSELKLSVMEAAHGRWDPLRIDQVLTNLVSNAVRHGAGKPIELSVESAADGVRMVVRDHGEGIPPEQMATLFGRFQRGDSRASQGGLGLGLFISRHIAQAHGGDIRVESALGEGTTFTVELPRRPVKEGGA
ncbi:MAG TPA: ATP-binding protein [Kofleriaceae bacterium]|nr:ATP-binding protein [Kofleriaceae bacterium]